MIKPTEVIRSLEELRFSRLVSESFQIPINVTEIEFGASPRLATVPRFKCQKQLADKQREREREKDDAALETPIRVAG